MSFNSRAPERPGNTSSHPFRLRNWRARSRTATACGLNGTRCFFPAFMRSPESVQVRLSKLISDQCAPHTFLGGLGAPTRPLLWFLDVYKVSGDDIGTRRRGSEGPRWRWNHSGGLAGTNTLARQRGDGINYAVLFNRRAESGRSYVAQIRETIDDFLDTTRIEWPEPRRASWTAASSSPTGRAQIIER